jgi:hypothetical protein
MNQRLPNDIINIILEYDGRIKYRRGIYVNQITKDDPRNNMVRMLLYKKMEIIRIWNMFFE